MLTPQMTDAPANFVGTLGQLIRDHMLCNLPAPASVVRLHSLLQRYLATDDPLFLVRVVRGLQRRETRRNACGHRLRATDNSPAWWMHYHAFVGSDPGGSVFETMLEGAPCHIFDVARVVPTTANKHGWYVAHINPVKDGDTDWQSWSRDELTRRFVRNVHPCNYFLVPLSLRRLGEDPSVIAAVARVYADRYAEVWEEFRLLARAGDTDVCPASLDSVVGEPIVAPRTSESSEAGTPGHCVSYRYSRLAFVARHIEPLAWHECFTVITPEGPFRMTKADFYRTFPGVAKSRSYRERGLYHFPAVPARAEQFRVADG